MASHGSSSTTPTKVLSRRGRVADVPKLRDYRLRRHHLGWFISIVSMLNVSSMPLAAYLSEPLPWQGTLSAPETYSNYSAFNGTFLALNKQRYSNATLPINEVFFVDAVNNVEVTRARLHKQDGPLRMDRDACFTHVLLGLPGLIFYTEAHMDLICNVVGPSVNATNTSVSSLENGSCYHSRFCSLVFGRSCLWLVPGDALSNDSGTGSYRDVVTLYFVHEAVRDPIKVWLMFIYRIGTTLLVWYRLYVHYYIHCWQLELLVHRRGHRANMPPGDWTYELVLGDPTAIVLMDPWVATLYMLDIWLSAIGLGTAIIVVAESSDLLLTLLSILYLSRSVWFAYWGLCLASCVLKRWHKEHCFARVDPTLVAIAVTISGPLAAYTSGHSTLFVRLDQWLFYCFVPTDVRNQELEVILVCVCFTCFTISLPLLHGVVARLVGCKPSVEYSSCAYNNVKNAVMFRLAQRMHATPQLPARGGTLYEAMELYPHLKRYPTISQRGADCFLFCYCDGQLVERLRLSLVRSLDTTESAMIPRATEPSAYVVFELQPPSLSNAVGPMLQTGCSYEMRAPPELSAWCV